MNMKRVIPDAETRDLALRTTAREVLGCRGFEIPLEELVLDGVPHTFHMPEHHERLIEGKRAGWVISTAADEKCPLPIFAAGCGCGGCASHASWSPRPARELTFLETRAVAARKDELLAKGRAHGARLTNEVAERAQARTRALDQQRAEESRAAAALRAAAGPGWRL